MRPTVPQWTLHLILQSVENEECRSLYAVLITPAIAALQGCGLDQLNPFHFCECLIHATMIPRTFHHSSESAIRPLSEPASFCTYRSPIRVRVRLYKGCSTTLITTANRRWSITDEPSLMQQWWDAAAAGMSRYLILTSDVLPSQCFYAGGFAFAGSSFKNATFALFLASFGVIDIQSRWFGPKTGGQPLGTFGRALALDLKSMPTKIIS